MTNNRGLGPGVKVLDRCLESFMIEIAKNWAPFVLKCAIFSLSILYLSSSGEFTGIKAVYEAY